MIKNYYKMTGLDTYTNPLLSDGQLIHAVNVDSLPLGGKQKRFGYHTYLNAPDNAPVNSLWSFNKNDGTTFWNYRASGSLIYYSTQGTSDWAVCGNGTIADGAHVGFAVLNNTMIVGDGFGSTRHTVDGTSFTNTNLAPPAPFFAQYQNRIYAAGTASTLFFSTANDPTNWQTSGTSDSSSLQITGAGKLSQPFVSSDRLIVPKNLGAMYRWDGYSVVDLATSYGPSSPYGIAEVEGYRLFINRYGLMGYGGAQPELLSNAIQRQFYNPTGEAIRGTAFQTIPAAIWYYNYFASVGSVRDDFVDRTIPDAIIKYDFQKNEFLDYSFAHKPTAFMSAIDPNGYTYLYFGDAQGNTYQYDPQSFDDNGETIFAEMIFVFTFEAADREKKWQYWRGMFNPGCQAKVQVACSNSYSMETLRWIDLGDVSTGAKEFTFPAGSRSRLLFVRIYEASKDEPFAFYGQSLQADIVDRK